MKFKSLYEFGIPKEVEVEKVEVSVNDDGNEVRVVKKEKEITKEPFALRKPSRSDIESGEFFFNKVVGQAVLEGLLPAALLAKRLHNDGGSLSEPEKDEFAEKYVERYNVEVRLQELSTKPREARTEEENAEHAEILKKISKLNQEMQEIQLRQQSLFEITAEAHARTKTIIWWLLFLLHRKDDKGEWVPVFEGHEHKHRQESYDELSDEDNSTPEAQSLLAQAVSHASQAVALWYYGRAKIQDEFEKAIKEANEQS